MFALHRINSHATKKFKIGHYSASFNAFCSVASIGSYHRGFRRAINGIDKIRYNCYGSNSKQSNVSKVDNENDLHAPPHIEIRGRYFGTPPGIDNMSNTGLMKESYLYGEESNRKSFADIGIIPELCDAVQSVVLNAHTSLSTTSTVHATQIQSACANAIFTGKDVVLAAETGSGKTLAYLVPLVQQCLEFKRKQLQSLDVSYTPYPLAVVLVPNKDLVTQVYSVLTSLLSKLQFKELMSNTATKESNTSLNLTIHAAISPTSANQWPYHLNTFSKTEKTLETHSQLHENVKNVPICYTHSFDLNQTITADTIAAVEKRSFLPPDITICTPAFLSQIMESATITNSSAKHNRVVSNTDINGVKSNTSNMFEVCQHLRYLVLDEADMLLSGSYLQSMQKLMTILRRTKQHRIKQGSLSTHPTYPMQTILSAATIPTYGTKSLENIIQDMYPTAIRVANKQYLHSHHPQIIQHFLKIKDIDVFSNERLEALIALLRGHVAVESTPVADEIIASNVTGELPTMIFVNTSKNAVKLAEVLKQQYHMDCLQYHKLCSFETRQENIQAFHSGRCQILICTDSASRGLDLPFVKRVIQMEMATNVVQYLHRIGRASRAGRAGISICLYDNTNLDLLRAMRVVVTKQPILGNVATHPSKPRSISVSNENIAESPVNFHTNTTLDSTEEKIDETLEAAFSRRRGLRRKLKKMARRERESIH